MIIKHRKCSRRFRKKTKKCKRKPGPKRWTRRKRKSRKSRKSRKRKKRKSRKRKSRKSRTKRKYRANTIRDMSVLSIDIVSDLHIDQWNKNIKNKYPQGLKRHFPYNFNDRNSNILIVAGDISDDLDLTLDYLDKLSDIYDKILFVDGNHEHVEEYPNLFKKKEIIDKVNKLNNSKLVYLPNKPFKIGKTVFIGSCGWWDYKNEILTDYFKGWIKKFKVKDNLDFADNVIKKSVEEYNYIKNLVKKFSLDKNIENIVVVTHTVPIEQISDNINTNVNSKFYEIINGKNKISHWIFGHTHDSIETYKNNIHLICNPRGIPTDYNRKVYKIKTIDLSI